MPSKNFASASSAGKLSTRDRNLVNAIRLTPAEQRANYEAEVSLQNLNMLEQAIDSTSDPKIIRILSEERSNLINLLEERASITTEELRHQAATPESTAMSKLMETIQSLWK